MKGKVKRIMKRKNIKGVVSIVVVVFLALGVLGSTAVLFGSSGSSSPGSYKPPHQEVTVSSQYEKGNGVFYRESARFILTELLTDNTLHDFLSEITIQKKDGGVLLGNQGYCVGNSTGWIDVVDVDGNKALSVSRLVEQKGLRVDFLAKQSIGSKYVFEADILWQGTDGWFGVNQDSLREQLIFYFGSAENIKSNNFATFYGLSCKGESDMLYISTDTRNAASTYICKGEWANIRALYSAIDETSGYLAVYVNNVLAFQTEVDCTANASYYGFGIEIAYSALNTSFLVDNVYVSAVE